APHQDREALFPEAAPLADGAELGGHVLLHLAPTPVGLGLPVLPLEPGHHALEGRLVDPGPAVLVPVGEADVLAAGAVEEHLDLLRRRLAQGLLGIKADPLADRLQHAPEPAAVAVGPGEDPPIP